MKSPRQLTIFFAALITIPICLTYLRYNEHISLRRKRFLCCSFLAFVVRDTAARKLSWGQTRKWGKRMGRKKADFFLSTSFPSPSPRVFSFDLGTGAAISHLNYEAQTTITPTTPSATQAINTFTHFLLGTWLYLAGVQWKNVIQKHL